jgi:hypothetical protein
MNPKTTFASVKNKNQHIMDCPICRKKELSPLLPECTDCNTSMKAILMLNDQSTRLFDMAKQRIELEGELAISKKQNAEDSGIRRSQMFKILSLLLILPLVVWVCHKPKPTPVIGVLSQHELDSLTQIHNAQIADLQQDIASIEAQKIHAIYYTLKKDDTLEGLGELFYNNKRAGFRIAKDNLLSVDDYEILPTGKRLKIVLR